jgi:hypothetical protein
VIAGIMVGLICIPCTVLLSMTTTWAQTWFDTHPRLGEFLIFGTIFFSWCWVLVTGVVGLACLAAAKRRRETVRLPGVALLAAVGAWALLYFLFWFECAHSSSCMRM